MKPTLAALVLILPLIAPALADGPRVALIYSDYGDFRHRDDYDSRLADMGWPLTKFENTHFGDLASRLGEYDLVLGTALFNYSNVQDFSLHRDALLGFVREGGAVVLTDCNYGSLVQWLGGLGDGWAVTVANTQANPCPMAWMEAEHPLFTTPNRIESLGGSWAQMQVGEAWTVLARWEENGVAAALRREGRGFFYVTSRWPLDERLLTNLWTCLQFARGGLEATLPDLTTLRLGANRLTARVRNVGEAPVAVTIEVRDTPQKGEPAASSGSAELDPGRSASLQVALQASARGKHQLAAALSANGSTIYATEPVTVTVPPLLEVGLKEPWYRGAIYAAHAPHRIVLEARVTPDPGDEPASFDFVGRVVGTEGPVAVAPKEGHAEIVLPLGHVPKDKVSATVGLRRKGQRIAQETVEIPVIAGRPGQVSLDERGVTRVEGQPFFPIGIYHASLKDFARLSEMGFNSVVAWGSAPDSAEEGLNAARDAGLKVVLELSQFLRGEYNPTGLAEVIERVKEHPALLTWYTVDEPSGQQFEWCRSALALVRQMDPHHPAYLVSCSPGEFAQYATVTEVLAIDPYPIPHASVDAVANWVKTAQAAVTAGQPVWLIPQCHNQVAYSNPQGGRGPTPEEERCMVYQGLIYGAKGIVYYPWDDGPCGLVHDPALVRAVAQINAELAEIGPELLLAERRLVADSEPDRPGLRAASFVGKQHVYVIATNTGKDELAGSLPFPGAIDDQVDVLFEGRTVQTKKGVLNDHLAPLSLHIYRMPAP